MRENAVLASLAAAKEGLVAVPLFETRRPAAVELMRLAKDRLDAVIDHGRRHYGNLLLTIGDRATWSWLARTRNPYCEEIAAVRERLGRPGAVLLNMSYEWCCTAGVGADPHGVGSRLLRTLDWPMNGIGRNILVARQEAAAGAYYNVTWPGYVGVLTAMAPGRFAAAINQPPLRRVSEVRRVDWMIERMAMWRSDGLPPSHLLRRVFDDAATYEDAKQMLMETPLCMPAFFSLAGCQPGQACVVERLETAAVVHEAPACIANHWVGHSLRGHDRRTDSRGRLAHMQRIFEGAADDFSWVVPPILSPTTRLAVIANPARGSLKVQGWEKCEVATTVFELVHPGAVKPPATTPAERAA